VDLLHALKVPVIATPTMLVVVVVVEARMLVAMLARVVEMVEVAKARSDLE